MALRIKSSPPALDDFTPLSEYNAQTPLTFDGKGVLHQLARATIVKIPTTEFEQNAELKQLAGANATSADEDGNVHIPDVDVWATNKYIVFYASKQSIGITVSYPSITITAQDGAEVLLELTLSPADVADEDIEVLQLRILPTSVEFPENDDCATNGTTSEAEQTNGSSTSTTNGANAHPIPPSASLFHAISNCQELNPDPRLPGDEDDDDEMGGTGSGNAFFDETAPGATGWITSENMADFMDEDGNFRMPTGATVIGGDDEAGTYDDADGDVGGNVGGAGSVRRRDEAGLDGEGGAAGAGSGDGESKWQRTS